MILVSACLLGVNCRYNGTGSLKEEWLEALKGLPVVPVCPEQLGGLATPRPPAEIVGENPVQVVTSEGADVTDAFQKGAEEMLRIVQLLEARVAVLKERSPSCGKNQIHDGTFSGHVVPGSGLTARAFKAAGIAVFSEEELELFKRHLGNEVR